jgi:EAL domain-containing protein (putative c-di-GMP-specific phosphodiesterase class I)
MNFPVSVSRDVAVASLAAKRVREQFLKDLELNRFILFSQTIAPVCSRERGDYREVLIRFKEEERNLQSPGMFLPLLEEQGLMPLLDRWIVARVLKGLREIEAEGRGRAPRFSVNLCADTLRDESTFSGYALEQIRNTVERAEALTLEILVSDALANPRSLARLMLPLRSVGCSFALSGFAGDDEPAFELARSLGFAFLKIDGSMLTGISVNPKAREALFAISRRCHEYGIQTICMRVETPQALEVLRGIDVDYAQGFGIERPRLLEFRSKTGS